MAGLPKLRTRGVLLVLFLVGEFSSTSEGDHVSSPHLSENMRRFLCNRRCNGSCQPCRIPRSTRCMLCRQSCCSSETGEDAADGECYRDTCNTHNFPCEQERCEICHFEDANVTECESEDGDDICLYDSSQSNRIYCVCKGIPDAVPGKNCTEQRQEQATTKGSTTQVSTFTSNTQLSTLTPTVPSPSAQTNIQAVILGSILPIMLLLTVGLVVFCFCPKSRLMCWRRPITGNNNSGERRRKDGERMHSEQQPTGPSTASNIGRSAATDTSNPIYEVSLPMDQTQDKNSKYLETESRTSTNTSNIKQPATNDTSNPIYGVPLPMDEIQDGSSRHLEKRPKASPSESNIEQSATNDTLNPIYGVPFPMDQIQGMTFPSLSGDGGTPCRSCGDSANDVMLSPPPPEVEGKEARGGHQYFVLEQESPPSRQPRQNTEAPHGKETIALEGFAPRDGHGTKKAGEDPETTRDDMQSRGLQGNQSDVHSPPKGPYYFTLEPPFGNQDDETSETTSQGESSETEGYNHVKRQRAHEAQSPNYSHLTPQSEYDHINRFGHMHSTYGDMSQFHGYSMYSHLKSHDEK